MVHDGHITSTLGANMYTNDETPAPADYMADWERNTHELALQMNAEYDKRIGVTLYPLQVLTVSDPRNGGELVSASHYDTSPDGILDMAHAINDALDYGLEYGVSPYDDANPSYDYERRDVECTPLSDR